MTELKVVKTDTLIMEYVLLPIMEMQRNFLYRFIEPIETYWLNGQFPLFSMSEWPSIQDDPSKLHTAALYYWRDMLYANTTPEEWPEEGAWMRDINKVTLRECHIVPKPVPYVPIFWDGYRDIPVARP